MFNNNSNTLKYMRTCYGCGSNKTTHNEYGSEQWLTNKPTDLCLCKNCRYHIFVKYMPSFKQYINSADYKIRRYINNHKRMAFKEKYITLKDNPRTGKCSKCCNRVGDSYIDYKGEKAITRKIDIHHIEYNDENPLEHTVELCCSCHALETWKTRKLAHGQQ